MLQLTLLIVAMGLVVVLHDGVWASDTIVIWTAVVAAVLSLIVISQIWMVLKSSERAKIAERGKRHESKKRPPSNQRQVPPAARKENAVNHTQRFRGLMIAREQAKRESEREESRLLNIEADIRIMNETKSKW